MRITNRDIEAVCNRINVILKTPLKPYVKVGDKFVAQVGNYHISGANGGFALHRMVNENGGVSDPFGHHMPKSELYYRMHAFISGLECGKNGGKV